MTGKAGDVSFAASRKKGRRGQTDVDVALVEPLEAFPLLLRTDVERNDVEVCPLRGEKSQLCTGKKGEKSTNGLKLPRPVVHDARRADDEAGLPERRGRSDTV
jgi:hypothetical protein